MSSKWSIDYYEVNDNSPIYDFINSLDEKTQGKLSRTFDMLEEFGTFLGPPHLKKITGTPLWELRILGEDSIRIFYILNQERTFLLLHGFKKKTQKTPTKELKIALTRLKNIKNRDN